MINHDKWGRKDFLLNSCDFTIPLTMFTLQSKTSNQILKMNPEEHELYLKVTTEGLSTKRVVMENLEPNVNSRHHPLFVEFSMPEEIESEHFNERR